MLSDVEAATERVIAVRGRVAEMPDGVSAQELEDELCEGYAHALAVDAWLTEADNRLHELIDGPASPQRGRELRTLAAEHHKVQRGVIELRRELAGLRAEHTRLRAGAKAV